jgi:hypothetical protein
MQQDGFVRVLYKKKQQLHDLVDSTHKSSKETQNITLLLSVCVCVRPSVPPPLYSSGFSASPKEEQRQLLQRK